VGCEARKIPADAGVFFLDFPLYRTYQTLAKGINWQARWAFRVEFTGRGYDVWAVVLPDRKDLVESPRLDHTLGCGERN